ncbi:InlB B-repeat-containing protein [Ruminococcaceae bacterium OttesenSCG-928-D13]|nr:InlB B-repeat-containing protein [Ruminococcaceae bacterium OttesenSCG-928-D13]
MRSFESPSPRGEKPEKNQPAQDEVSGGQAPASPPPAGRGATGQAGGHLYKSKPTPGGTTGSGPAQPGGRVYYSKKKAGDGAVAKQARFTSKQMRLNIMLGALVLVLIISLVLAALLPGCQQVPPASSSLASSCSVPVSSAPESYNKDELVIPESEYAGTMLEETEDAGDEYVEETLFIGDSNTERMIQYGSVTGVSMKNGIGIESMGIGSVTGLRCVRFSGYSDMTIPQAVKVMQPKRILIMFGTNNVGLTTETFIDQYVWALEAIGESWPYADIIIGSVLPIAQHCTYGSLSQKAIDEFNLALVEMAKDKGYKFLNWSEALKDTSTGYAKSSSMIGDGVHITSDGLELLFDYFRTHSYITEDTRPKPLQTIPTRLPTPEGLRPKPESSSSDSDSSSKSSSSSKSASSSKSESDSASTSLPASTAPDPSSQAPVSITVAVAAGDGGSVSGTVLSATGTPGGSVTLTVTAIPNEGYEFTGWSAGSPNGDKLTVNIPADCTANFTVYAIFKQIEAPPPLSEATGDPAGESTADPAAESTG